MVFLILLFSILVLMAGVVMLVKPEIVFRFLEKNLDSPVIYITAILVRLLLGTALILQGPFSNFPVSVEILGWIFVLAAIVLALIGRRRFAVVLSWLLARFGAPGNVGRFRGFGRVGGALALAFGGFLLLAFV